MSSRGKLLPRDRVAHCSTPDSPFLESGGSPPMIFTMETLPVRA
jgi:hypothetical protein